MTSPLLSRLARCCVVSVFLSAGSASAAGFHFFKVEAVAATNDVGAVAGGRGFSTFSELVHLWAVAGDPALEGPFVREAWLESRSVGPVIGVVPPTFVDLVRPYGNALLVPWGSFVVGGEAATRTSFTTSWAQHLILNIPGYFQADPRRVYAGPTVGIGLNGTWWRDWKDVPDNPAMTGKLTGQAGLALGGTVRDTWYAQARATGRLDLFGDHQRELVVMGITGVSLDRVGVPFGVEITGELDQGDDNVHAAPATTWKAHGAFYWKLTPPYQTRLEEAVEREAPLPD